MLVDENCMPCNNIDPYDFINVLQDNETCNVVPKSDNEEWPCKSIFLFDPRTCDYNRADSAYSESVTFVEPWVCMLKNNDNEVANVILFVSPLLDARASAAIYNDWDLDRTSAYYHRGTDHSES